MGVRTRLDSSYLFLLKSLMTPETYPFFPRVGSQVLSLLDVSLSRLELFKVLIRLLT